MEAQIILICSNYHNCIIVNIIKYQPYALAENWFFTTRNDGTSFVQFFSWTWQPSLTSKDSSQWTAGGFQQSPSLWWQLMWPIFCIQKHHFSRFSWKWKMAFFWLYLKGKDPLGGTFFFHFHEGVFQVSKTYLSRCVPGMSHEWVPFPTKDVVVGQKDVVICISKYPASRASSFNYRRSHKKNVP